MRFSDQHPRRARRRRVCSAPDPVSVQDDSSVTTQVGSEWGCHCKSVHSGREHHGYHLGRQWKSAWYAAHHNRQRRASRRVSTPQTRVSAPRKPRHDHNSTLMSHPSLRFTDETTDNTPRNEVFQLESGLSLRGAGDRSWFRRKTAPGYPNNASPRKPRRIPACWKSEC